MRLQAIVWVWVVACGALAGWVVGGVVPAGLREPFLHQQPFRLVPKAGETTEVTDARWLFVPFPFGDFDLRMDVELGEGVDLDVLVRRVEPRIVGSGLLPFHGRWSVLRVTTGRDGPAWRSRDDALVAGRGGGASLAPGLPATLWIEGRGRWLSANVAGKPQGSFVADDSYGMFTLVAHGGKAVVHSMTIEPRPSRTWLWSRWLWVALGGLGGAFVGAIAWWRGAAFGLLLPIAPLAALLAWLLTRHVDLDLAFPHPGAMGLLLAGCLGVLIARGSFVQRIVWFVALLAALLGARVMLRHDTARADALFGPRAGSQLSEAHARLVRGPQGLHSLGRKESYVFLLGGQLLYDRGAPGDHLELLVGRELRARTGKAVDVPCLPTADGHVAQQWALFRTCFTGYRPAVVVVGVPRDEMAMDAATGAPRSSAGRVRTVLGEVRAWCRENGSALVLFADSGLPDELRQVVRDAAGDGVVVVEALDGSAPVDVAKQLATAIVPLLPK